MHLNALIVKKLFLCNCRGTFFDADFDRSKHTIRVKGWLKQKGFATVIFADVNLRGAEDKKIAEFAMKSGMTILTKTLILPSYIMLFINANLQLFSSKRKKEPAKVLFKHLTPLKAELTSTKLKTIL